MKANLLLIRHVNGAEATEGKIYVNGHFIAYTLELPWRNNQRNISCIPAGVYPCRIRPSSESPSKNYDHIEIQDVPGRSYILIEIANFVKSLKGCVAVGVNWQHKEVHMSKVALECLVFDLRDFDKMDIVIKNR